MRRRQFVALLPAVFGAGCASSRFPDDPGAGAGGPTESETGTGTDRPTPVEPFRTVPVGSRENVTDTEDNRPHGVQVHNEGTARDIEVRIDRAPSASDVVKTAFEESVSFPANGLFRVELLEPARYLVHVTVPSSGQETSFAVERERFDCNVSRHEVDVPAEGVIDVSVLSTLVACEADGGAETETEATPTE